MSKPEETHHADVQPQYLLLMESFMVWYTVCVLKWRWLLYWFLWPEVSNGYWLNISMRYDWTCAYTQRSPIGCPVSPFCLYIYALTEETCGVSVLYLICVKYPAGFSDREQFVVFAAQCLLKLFSALICHAEDIYKHTHIYFLFDFSASLTVWCLWMG